MRRTYKFEIGPPASRKKIEKKNEKKALWIATPVCIGAYYAFGAGGWMLFLAMATYVIAKLWLDGRSTNARSRQRSSVRR